MKPVISALPALTPFRIVSTKTGELLTWNQFSQQSLLPLINLVIEETVTLYERNKDRLLEDSANLKYSPAEYARQKGYRVNHSLWDRGIKAKSRIERLIQHKLMSETASYVRNPNPHKQPHRFSRTLNLGAVDKQMAQLEREHNVLILTWKCWDDDYELSFHIPAYANSRIITKWSLPVVSDKGFVFTMEEQPTPSQGNNQAGVDLGRVEPFTLAVVNENSSLIAQYTANNQVMRVNLKRERILREVSHLTRKIEALKTLGETERASVLITQQSRKRAKASRLGQNLAQQLSADLVAKATRHNVNLIKTENLKWVTGAKYGSKWAHGKITQKLEHSAARAGVRVRRVNPRNTSQSCHVCGVKITHNTKTRTVRCVPCKTTLDRDMNAALNIAKTTHQSEPRVLIGTGVVLSQPVLNPERVIDYCSLDPLIAGLTA